jgi:hypothetical protein
MRAAALSSVVVLALCAGAVIPVSAAVVDFETTALGGGPVDDAAVTGIFFDGATGMRFGFDTDNDLVIDAPAHFEYRWNGFDAPTAAYSSASSTYPVNADVDHSPGNIGGDWLLREPKGAETPSASVFAGADWFIVEYSGVLPTACSGEIWDVDFGEQYVVNAYDVFGALIGTYVPPVGIDADLPGSRNGLDTPFFFSGLSAPIAKLGIYLQSTQGGGGFAFDNFNGTQVPAPGAAALIGLGAMASGMRRRR